MGKDFEVGQSVKCISGGMFTGCIGKVISINQNGVLVKFAGINHQQRINPFHLEALP